MVSYRRPKLLAETVRSLGPVDELIVIEDTRPHGPDEFINPAPLWNHALDMATGDVLVLQNPECLHVNHVVSALAKVPSGQAWFASCEALTRTGEFSMWYTHPVHRQKPYFFCGAIHRADMVRWDEDFTGEGYEDDDLAERLKLKGATFRWLPPEEAHVQHQWHPKGMARSNADIFLRKHGKAI